MLTRKKVRDDGGLPWNEHSWGCCKQKRGSDKDDASQLSDSLPDAYRCCCISMDSCLFSAIIILYNCIVVNLKAIRCGRQELGKDGRTEEAICSRIRNGYQEMAPTNEVLGFTLSNHKRRLF